MSQPRISLEQWRALVAVVDRGGYAQAAAALHKSQSAITYAIQQLEAQLGVRAFTVQGRRAVLTPTGDLLVRRARALVEDAAGLEEAARRVSSGWEAELRVSVDVIFPTWLLFQCLAVLNAESPDTRIEVQESVLGHRTDALARGEADLAIFSSVPPGFLGEALMRVRFVLVAHPDHPLHALGRPVTLRDLRRHRQLVVRESSPDRATRPAVDVARRWTVSHMATSIEAACAGHGFAYLPEHRIRGQLEAGLLKPLPASIGGERYAELYLVHADPDRAGPAALRLATLLRETVARECAETEPAPSPGAAARRRRKA
jgi:DNA-binding transcriptional LysR family regulator